VWEFAYDWEVEPGVWTMTVSHEDTVLATASFMVVQPDPLAQAQTPPQSLPSPKPAKPGESRQDKKAADITPAKSQATPSASLTKSEDAKAPPDKQPEAQKPEASRSDSPKTDTPRHETAKPDTQKPAATRQDASPSAPQKDRPAKPLAEVQGPGVNQDKSSSKELAGASGKRVQVLVAGVYSEEARALWVAAFLRKGGVKACVRMEDRGGKKRWSLVAGWRDTPDEARRAKEELTPTVGEIVIVPMNAAELEKGLQCR